jgi:hypothetical protein
MPRKARHPHHDPDRNRGDTGEREGAEDPQQTDAGMLRERRIGETVRGDQDELRIHRLWRGQKERLDPVQVGRGKPQSEDSGDRNKARDEAAALAGHAECVARFGGFLGENPWTTIRCARGLDWHVGSQRRVVAVGQRVSPF